MEVKLMSRLTSWSLRFIFCCLVICFAASALFAIGWEWQNVPAKGERGHPVLVALQQVADYDIPWQDYVIVQLIYSQSTSEIVLLQPYVDPDAKPRRPNQNWEIRVEFSQPRSASHPKVIAHNITKLAAGKKPAVTLGKVVATAAYCLYQEGVGSALAPATVHAGWDHAEEGPWACFERLPATPGGFTTVNLSKDLKRYQIIPGW
jgi:hypothetical protein